jgi:hypothetical protein
VTFLAITGGNPKHCTNQINEACASSSKAWVKYQYLNLHLVIPSSSSPPPTPLHGLGESPVLDSNVVISLWSY